MRGAFDYNDLDRPQQRQDTELTLGATTLLLIFFGLVLLCGLCFGLGYATGHHGSVSASALSASVADSPAASSESGLHKPAPQSQLATADESSSGSGPALADEPPAPHIAAAPVQPAPSAEVSAPPASGTSTASSTASLVRPAMGVGISPIGAAQPAASAVGPALGGASLMVQIASIAEQQDADVLVAALRRHGYGAIARREPLDGLVHVRIGPFKTRDEAEQWRQKLLNDGYNAIVQP